MSGQSPRVADAAQAFVGVTSHLTGSRWGGSRRDPGPEGWRDGSVVVLPGSGIACDSHSPSAFVLLQIMNLSFPLFFLPERMGMAPWQEMLMGVTACPGRSREWDRG